MKLLANILNLFAFLMTQFYKKVDFFVESMPYYNISWIKFLLSGTIIHIF